VQLRRPYVLFLLLVVPVVVAGFWMGRTKPAANVLTAVPADAWLLATFDVGALRASPLLQPLLGGPDAGPGSSGRASASQLVPGLGTLSEACGFDPLSRIDEIVLCSPEGGEHGDFGVALTGRFTRDELTQCAGKIARARGGQPETSERGDYTILEDKADTAHTRFAYREGGPFLVGRGAWLDAMIDAAEGRAPRQRPEHTELRRALVPKPGEPPPVVVITALLPTLVRLRLRGELGAELGGDGVHAYASVLAVASAGFALGTAGPASQTTLKAELRCETSDACVEVKSLIERKRMSFSRDLGLRLVGIGPLLDSLSVDVQGTSLSASARAGTSDLARVVKRVLDLRAPPGLTRPAPPISAVQDGG
jgi:hypothetical protein